MQQKSTASPDCIVYQNTGLGFQRRDGVPIILSVRMGAYLLLLSILHSFQARRMNPAVDPQE